MLLRVLVLVVSSSVVLGCSSTSRQPVPLAQPVVKTVKVLSVQELRKTGDPQRDAWMGSMHGSIGVLIGQLARGELSSIYLFQAVDESSGEVYLRSSRANALTVGTCYPMRFRIACYQCDIGADAEVVASTQSCPEGLSHVTRVSRPAIDVADKPKTSSRPN